MRWHGFARGVLTTITAVLIVFSATEIALRNFELTDATPDLRVQAPDGQDFQLLQPNAEVVQPVSWERVYYRTNEMGFRGEPIIAGRPKILLLGDSFTFGLYLPESDTISSRLQSLIGSESQVLNGGVPASGLAAWVAFLEDYGAQVQPDIVVLMVNYTSLSVSLQQDLYALDASGVLLRRNPTTGVLQKAPLNVQADLFQQRTQAPDAHDEKWYARFVQSSSVLTLFHRAYRILSGERRKVEVQGRGEASKLTEVATDASEVGTTPFEAEPYVSGLMHRARLVADRLGARLIVVDLGFSIQASGAQDPTDLLAAKLMPVLAQKERVDFFDMQSVLLAGIDDGVAMWMEHDGHPTASANSLIADRLFQALSNE